MRRWLRTTPPRTMAAAEIVASVRRSYGRPRSSSAPFVTAAFGRVECDAPVIFFLVTIERPHLSSASMPNFQRLFDRVCAVWHPDEVVFGGAGAQYRAAPRQ